MAKRFIYLIVFFLWWNLCTPARATSNETIYAVLTVEVMANQEETEKDTKPIEHARVIVINSFGHILATKLTNANGEVNMHITIPRDARFPMKNMGEATIIVVANGYNEFINFSVPVNEYTYLPSRIRIPLWKINPTRRNEPRFINGSFHRFTVFGMLDYYAQRIGLKRQQVKLVDESLAPWGP
ncbi:hypothetical protein [Priestia taiwanensis]|uniref:hypothetical protein n=1 Tax=Priestia taiwanensis TaxID=1347902 RepID=UPI0016685868|nr:hypothetical protein [Priestia taiwanensis]MBM7362331.1 hypothetical protein [Priestia taiwanensis]